MTWQEVGDRFALRHARRGPRDGKIPIHGFNGDLTCMGADRAQTEKRGNSYPTSENNNHHLECGPPPLVSNTLSKRTTPRHDVQSITTFHHQHPCVIQSLLHSLTQIP